jgi:hypothetical protein
MADFQAQSSAEKHHPAGASGATLLPDDTNSVSSRSTKEGTRLFEHEHEQLSSGDDRMRRECSGRLWDTEMLHLRKSAVATVNEGLPALYIDGDSQAGTYTLRTSEQRAARECKSPKAKHARRSEPIKGTSQNGSGFDPADYGADVPDIRDAPRTDDPKAPANGAPAGPQDKVADRSRRPADLTGAPPLSKEEMIAKLQHDFGTSIEVRDGKYVCTLPNCDNKKILETDASEDGLKQMRQRLEQVATEQIARLEKQYNVHFIPGDQELKYYKQTFHTRQPRLDELNAIEAGLLKSYPATVGQTVDIALSKEPVINSAAFYAAVGFPRPTVVIEPQPELLKHAMLEPDAAKNNPRMHGHTLESIIEHELGHHSQAKAGWNDDEAKRNSMARQMGFEPLKMGQNTEWLLRGKHGEFYRCSPPTELNAPEEWYRCDIGGNPIDSQGQRCDVAHAQVPTQTVDEQAAIKQMGHCANPIELQAEGFKFFRMDQERRAELLRTSSAFYRMIKQWDQQEIDEAFGTGKYVRSPDGGLVEDNEANRKAIQRFELEAVGLKNGP